MRVAYDVSVLGTGLYSQGARTGVARVVDNLRSALTEENDVDLLYCVSHSLEQYVQLRINSEIFDAFDCNSLCPPQNLFAKLITHVASEIYPKQNLLKNNLIRYRFLCVFLKVVGALCRDGALSDMKGIDIFHSPFYPFPESIKGLKKIQRFITVHDLIPILCPHYFGGTKDHLAHRIIQSIGPDDWVLANSEFTKKDLCNYAKIDPSRVFVTPLAASKMFYRCTDPKQLLGVRKRYGLPDGPYVLSVCTLEPRKNIDQVIRSFIQLIQEQHIRDLNLVLVGTKGWDIDRVFSEIDHAATLRARIVVTGYVPDEDLPPLYSGAMMFVYPSFYEGFGLPPLEAMQCGVPVITSNTSSLPEVVGDAGIMVDPSDGEGLSQAMLDVFSQPALRDSLSWKSLQRSQIFSWEKCSKSTIEAYKVALDS